LPEARVESLRLGTLTVLTERVALRVMTWLRKRDHVKDDEHASNEAPEPSFTEQLAQLAMQRGTVENVKDDTGETEGPGPAEHDDVGIEHVDHRRERAPEDVDALLEQPLSRGIARDLREPALHARPPRVLGLERGAAEVRLDAASPPAVAGGAADRALGVEEVEEVDAETKSFTIQGVTWE
jgi:hypothetical protein